MWYFLKQVYHWEEYDSNRRYSFGAGDFFLAGWRLLVWSYFIPSAVDLLFYAVSWGEIIIKGSERPKYLPEIIRDIWKAIHHYVMLLSHGGENLFDGRWMKAQNMAAASCNDGIRPVVFKLEALDEPIDE